MINIDELNRINEDRYKRRLVTYDNVLKKCHDRIKTVANSPRGGTFCFYIVPSFLFGIPIFDLNSCIVYIVQKLIKNGFEVNYTHPNLLYISWLNRKNSIDYKNKEDKPKPKKEFKKIENYKPSGQFLYDLNSMDFLKK
tara:strand:- start:140 stop:556 length:417 start_codon:yes stop_codon:yes gene_type:complete